MKLKTEIIERLRGRRDVKQRIAQEMGIVKSTLWRWMLLNEDEGPLTSYKCASIIAEGLNLSHSELYIEETIKEECHESVTHN